MNKETAFLQHNMPAQHVGNLQDWLGKTIFPAARTHDMRQFDWHRATACTRLDRHVSVPYSVNPIIESGSAKTPPVASHVPTNSGAIGWDTSQSKRATYKPVHWAPVQWLGISCKYGNNNDTRWHSLYVGRVPVAVTHSDEECPLLVKHRIAFVVPLVFSTTGVSTKPLSLQWPERNFFGWHRFWIRIIVLHKVVGCREDLAKFAPLYANCICHKISRDANSFSVN